MMNIKKQRVALYHLMMMINLIISVKFQAVNFQIVRVGKKPYMSRERKGDFGWCYHLARCCFYRHIPCKLFSQDVGSKNRDTRSAKIDWFQHGEVDSDFTPLYIIHLLTRQKPSLPVPLQF